MVLGGNKLECIEGLLDGVLWPSPMRERLLQIDALTLGVKDFVVGDITTTKAVDIISLVTSCGDFVIRCQHMMYHVLIRSRR